jgi:hypothetical protein
MRGFSRRQLVGSAGAGLLLAPFLTGALRANAQTAAPRAKRLLLFCTMGTFPPIWTPSEVSGESITTFSASTSPLAAIKDSVILIEGMPSGNVNNNHGSPDALTGIGSGYYNGQLKVSVDQFVASKMVASGIDRPIASLLLGSRGSAIPD